MVEHSREELKNTVKTLFGRLSVTKPTLKRNLYLLGNPGEFNKDFQDKKEYVNTDEKFITFIMCLKNRPDRSRLSIENLVTPETAKYCNFIIVEDTSDNLLDLNDFEYKKYLDHYIVDTGVNWSRAKLLNFGIKRSTTELVAMWDCDFLYPEKFTDYLRNIVKYVDFSRFFFAINSFETHNTNVRGTVFRQGEPYGYMWVYHRESLVKVKAFHEKMQDHGWEERYLQDKLKNELKLKTVHSYSINKKMMVFHYSHTSDIRGKFGTPDNKKLRNKPYDTWGETPVLKKYTYS